MTFDEFRASLGQEQPPPGLDRALEALWWTGRGDWEHAHALAQAGADAVSAQVHAHLHRVEGDAGNAAYWYRRAGVPPSDLPLSREWETIVRSLL